MFKQKTEVTDINQFLEWVKEKPKDRSATIEIGRSNSRGYVQVWVYDYSLMAGQYVTDVDSIDLEKVALDKERETYERLKAKFEGDTK